MEGREAAPFLSLELFYMAAQIEFIEVAETAATPAPMEPICWVCEKEPARWQTRHPTGAEVCLCPLCPGCKDVEEVEVRAARAFDPTMLIGCTFCGDMAFRCDSVSFERI